MLCDGCGEFLECVPTDCGFMCECCYALAMSPENVPLPMSYFGSLEKMLDFNASAKKGFPLTTMDKFLTEPDEEEDL